MKMSLLLLTSVEDCCYIMEMERSADVFFHDANSCDHLETSDRHRYSLIHNPAAVAP